MLKYFDLNQRVRRRLEGEPVELGPQVNRRPMAARHQIFLYLGIFFGVLFSSAIDRFKMQGEVSFNLSFQVCLVSAVIALIIVPIAYEKLKVDPGSPYIVQMGLFVQSGVFWHVLMTAAAKSLLPN